MTEITHTLSGQPSLLSLERRVCTGEQGVCVCVWGGGGGGGEKEVYGRKKDVREQSNWTFCLRLMINPRIPSFPKTSANLACPKKSSFLFFS